MGTGIDLRHAHAMTTGITDQTEIEVVEEIVTAQNTIDADRPVEILGPGITTAEPIDPTTSDGLTPSTIGHKAEVGTTVGDQDMTSAARHATGSIDQTLGIDTPAEIDIAPTSPRIEGTSPGTDLTGTTGPETLLGPGLTKLHTIRLAGPETGTTRVDLPWCAAIAA